MLKGEVREREAKVIKLYLLEGVKSHTYTHTDTDTVIWWQVFWI